MRRRLEYVNLIGVMALVVLCVTQWRMDRRLNLQVNQLEKIRNDQEIKLREQEQSLKEVQEDLGQFKTSFLHEQKSRAEAEQKLTGAERSNHQLLLERDQLKSSLTNWVNAVAVRDERLKDANARIQQLADELNASVHKFNELATNYNAVVKDLNELRARPSSPPAENRPPGPDRKP